MAARGRIRTREGIQEARSGFCRGEGGVEWMGGPLWSPALPRTPIASMVHEQIGVRGSAGDHKGPPIHSTPPSPLQNPDRASWMPSLVLILPLAAIVGTQIKNL